jgi:hypothetical protein
VVDGGNHAIASFINPAPAANSSFNIDRLISGAATGLGVAGGTPSLSSIPSIALDAANDRLFASTQLSVSVFDNASTANGNIPFSRRITATVNTGSGLRGVNFFSMTIDTTNNILYSADTAGEIHVFNSASTRTGAITPDRTVTPDLGATTVVQTFGIAVDKTRDMLYVGVSPSGASAFIMIYNGASNVNTNTIANNSRAPDRTITLQGAGSFHLDEAANRLYVSTFNGQVQVYDSASTLTGTPTVDRLIDLAGGVARFQIQHFIFVDTSRDKLYAVGNEATPDTSITWIIDNAHAANDNGGPASDGVGAEITATNTRLSGVAVKP